MRFDIDDTVYIVKKAKHQVAGWDEGMDKTVGQIGVVIEIHDDYGYQIHFEQFDQEYYFCEEAVGAFDEIYAATLELPKDEWFLAPISKVVYKKQKKVIKFKSIEFHTFADKDGNVVDSKYFQLVKAPVACKGFDYVDPMVNK